MKKLHLCSLFLQNNFDFVSPQKWNWESNAKFNFSTKKNQVPHAVIVLKIKPHFGPIWVTLIGSRD